MLFRLLNDAFVGFVRYLIHRHVALEAIPHKSII